VLSDLTFPRYIKYKHNYTILILIHRNVFYCKGGNIVYNVFCGWLIYGFLYLEMFSNCNTGYVADTCAKAVSYFADV
jgi:hypothetical protein